MCTIPRSSKRAEKRGRESFWLNRRWEICYFLGMRRRARSIQGGLVYHILNRANARTAIFGKEEDYAAFERVLEQAYARESLRILAYCVMPNHWHMVAWPKRGSDTQVCEFFGWLTVTHTQRWHAHYHTSGSGHLYQGRFKSFPVETNEHLDAVLCYVERNPVRANLVDRAEAWRSCVDRFREAARTAAKPGVKGPLRGSA